MTILFGPRNDVAFKRLFGTEQNSDIVISLLNEVLKDQLDKPIVKIKFLKTFQDPERKSKKQSIVDALCEDQDGCRYIIEMQIANIGGYEERAQNYAYKSV